MKAIKFFLDRFNFSSQDTVVKNALRDLIKEKWGADLPSTAIKINQAKIFLNAAPVLKSELRLHHTELAAELNRRAGTTVEWWLV